MGSAYVCSMRYPRRHRAMIEAQAFSIARGVNIHSGYQPVAMPPGDTVELRTGVGVAIGGLAGLPFFVVGATPGAVISGSIRGETAPQDRYFSVTLQYEPRHLAPYAAPSRR